MTDTTVLQIILKRDRAVVLGSLLAVTALAWLYLVSMALGMENMAGAMGEAMAMAQPKPWTPVDLGLMFVMWVVMMVGMMLPSAAPMILLFVTISRKKRATARPFVPASVFTFGYIAAWTGFSMLATVLQWGMHSAALLSPMMVSTSGILGGLLFIGAGVFQWTPLKNACLRKCRSPLDFIMFHWRGGNLGALRMGLEHGAFCVVCCWFLMALLFVGGVMNLLWVAAIAFFVLAEKVVPHGERVARISGVAMAAIGVYMLLSV